MDIGYYSFIHYKHGIRSQEGYKYIADLKGPSTKGAPTEIEGAVGRVSGVPYGGVP
jgi:hypothetical protein